MKWRMWYQSPVGSGLLPYFSASPLAGTGIARFFVIFKMMRLGMLQLIYKESWIYDVILIHNGIELKALMLFYCRSDINIHTVSDG